MVTNTNQLLLLDVQKKNLFTIRIDNKMIDENAITRL